MRLKKILSTVISLMLAILLCSCGILTDKPSDSDETETPEREVVLFGGEEDYRIVYPDSANDNVKNVLSQLINSACASLRNCTAHSNVQFSKRTLPPNSA